MRSFFKSFTYAFKGLGDFFRNHRNGQFHLAAAILTISLGFFCHLAPWEWCAVILCISIVTALEAINSSIEYLTDLVSPDYHPLAGKVKDMAAGAVLFAALAAGCIGLIIFLPKIVLMFSQ